jgi:adenylate kinase
MKKIKVFLMFGSPGSGKGTQGKILGNIPGFFHLACGDVFRSIDLRSDIGKVYLEYSSQGLLVPDDITMRLWQQQIHNMIILGRFKPEIDHLVLDGIPRNVNQAKLLDEHAEVKRLFHLSCPDRSKLVERLKRRALKENRLDDANEEIIRKRLITYEKESKPVLDHYGDDKVVSIDATQWPYQVLHDILEHIETEAMVA